MTAAPARLVIGVTGHRKFAAGDALAAKIDTMLDGIARAASREGTAAGGAGRGSPLRFVVLSPLAEGADRLVAERVLARGGAELEAVLPMAEAEYERDFATDASRDEFRSLLARAGTVHRLSGVSDRPEAYAAAGRYVVDHCDVLIAVWNGRTSNGPGGTAEIVAYARKRKRRLLVIDPSR
jgi:hypothetical protein